MNGDIVPGTEWKGIRSGASDLATPHYVTLLKRGFVVSGGNVT